MRKTLIWFAVALFAGALALLAWWGFSVRSHTPLSTPEDFAARSLLREMPEGASFAAAAYGAGGALPSAEAFLPWFRTHAGNGADVSEDVFRSQYDMLKDFLDGEAAVAVYTRPDGSGTSVLLAARPHPSFWPKMLLSRTKERVRAMLGKLREEKGVYTETLADGTPLAFAHRNGAIFLSNDAEILRRSPSGVFADAEEARLGWERAALTSEKHGPLGGVFMASLGESRFWGTLSLDAARWEAAWTFDADVLKFSVPVKETSAPGWVGREESALAMKMSVPAGALDADDYEANLPVRLDTLVGILESLRSAYLFPPADGDAFPSFVACLAPAPERREAMRESVEGALRLASWGAAQRTGGLVSPQVERRKNGHYDVASLPLGLANPCYADAAGSFLVATECRRLDPLLAGGTAEGGDADLLRVELRGGAMAECVRAFEGIAPMLSAAGMGGDAIKVDDAALDVLSRVRLASLRVFAREGANPHPPLVAGTLAVEWSDPLSPASP